MWKTIAPSFLWRRCAVPFKYHGADITKWRMDRTSMRQNRKDEVMKRIRYHFYDHQMRCGSPKITYLLHLEGLRISSRTVSIYIRQMNLRSVVMPKYRVQTTDSKHNHPLAPNTLNQQFKTSKPNTVWVTDITYIACREGRLYLASVLDLCTREIVGWRLYNHMETSLVMGALEEAYKAKRPAPGLLHRSDCGSQYTSKEYVEQLKSYGMESSMSRRKRLILPSTSTLSSITTASECMAR
ncbi:IS3 family transposase [Paenibacillus sp. FSL R5-0517]|uniref:IS3 family transposase n=1 Tax=Paenibacillus sp. FSL R5-0517 TaxID=2921647 RepID=UPI0030DDC85F